MNMKISERGQVTIPKSVREKFGLGQGAKVHFEVAKEGVLVKKSAPIHPVDQVRGVLKGFSRNIDQTIDELRGK